MTIECAGTGLQTLPIQAEGRQPRHVYGSGRCPVCKGLDGWKCFSCGGKWVGDQEQHAESCRAALQEAQS